MHLLQKLMYLNSDSACCRVGKTLAPETSHPFPPDPSLTLYNPPLHRPFKIDDSSSPSPLPPLSQHPPSEKCVLPLLSSSLSRSASLLLRPFPQVRIHIWGSRWATPSDCGLLSLDSPAPAPAPRDLLGDILGALGLGATPTTTTPAAPDSTPDADMRTGSYWKVCLSRLFRFQSAESLHF